MRLYLLSYVSMGCAVVLSVCVCLVICVCVCVYVCVYVCVFMRKRERFGWFMRCDQAKVCGKGFRMSDIKSVWLNDVMDVTLHNHNSTDTGGASTETRQLSCQDSHAQC